MLIRGTEYAIANTSGVALSPLIKCLGLDEIINAQEPLSETRVGEIVFEAIANSDNHRHLAYSIKAAIPSIPDSLVRYEFYLTDKRECKALIDSRISLEIDEIVAVIAAIFDEMSRKNQPVVETPPPPAIAPLSEVELKRQYLMKELALLGEE